MQRNPITAAFLALHLGPIVLGAMGCVTPVGATGSSTKSGAVPALDKVMVVVFENTDFDEAMAQPFFSRLARQGANLVSYYAVTHPSQGNYIAMTAGSLHKVRTDGNVDLDVRSLADLLEERGKSWKVYAEGYPGNCFLGWSHGDYVRKHVPFLSYRNIQNQSERCARIVNAGQLQRDIERGQLPDFSLYIPDLKNDGHDTGVAFADRWFQKAFGPLLANSVLMSSLTVAVTFDESSMSGDNHIYTVLLGNQVRPGSISGTRYDHYSLLKAIELGLGLGSLGLNDAGAVPVDDVWIAGPM